MAIQVSCTCGKSFKVAETEIGKRGKCSACGNVFRIAQPVEPVDFSQPTAPAIVSPPSPTPPSSRGWLQFAGKLTVRLLSLIAKLSVWLTRTLTGFWLWCERQLGAKIPALRSTPRSRLAMVGIALVVAMLLRWSLGGTGGEESAVASGDRRNQDVARTVEPQPPNQPFDSLRNKPQWVTSPALLAESPAFAAIADADPNTQASEAVLSEWKAAFELITGEEWRGTPAQFAEVITGQSTVGLDLSGWVVGVGMHGSHRDEQFMLLEQLPHLKWLDLKEVDFDSISDKALTSLRRNRTIDRLDLDNLKINREAMELVANLKGLRYLSLAGTRVTDDSLAQIAGLNRLQYLDLRDTRTTAKGNEHLRNLVKLETLYLNDRTVEGLQHLGRLTLLQDPSMLLPQKPMLGAPDDREAMVSRWISTSSTLRNYLPYRSSAGTEGVKMHGPDVRELGLGDAALPYLAGMSRFKCLDLSLISCTDDDLVHLAGLRNLVAIDLEGSRILGPGLRHLASLQELRYLNLGQTHLTDEHLHLLEALPRLTDIVVSATHVTEAGAKRLEGAMPRAIVVTTTSREELLSGQPWQDRKFEYEKHQFCPKCRQGLSNAAPSDEAFSVD